MKRKDQNRSLIYDQGGQDQEVSTVLPEKSQEKPQQAKVVAVGPGTEEVKMEVKKGDEVIYSKYSGTNVKLEGKEYVIVKQSDILAIVK